jgi:S1-C subfamily serine protease
MKLVALLVTFAALALPSCTLSAQQIRTQGGATMMQLSAKNTVILKEIGAIVTEDKGKVKVLMIPPANQRPQNMPDVDLQIGDEIGMASGKSVKSITDLRDAYEKSEVGKEFKIGVRRDGQAHIVSFERKDEKDMPQGGGMVMRRDEPGDENSDFFPAFGIGIKKEEAGVVISQVLPNAPKDLKIGDVVQSLNGTPVKNAKDFTKAFDDTKIGGNLKLELLRDGKPVSVTAKRPEPRQQIIRN